MLPRRKPNRRCTGQAESPVGISAFFPLSAGNGKLPAARPTSISRLKATAFLSGSTYTLCSFAFASLQLHHVFVSLWQVCSSSASPWKLASGHYLRSRLYRS